MDFHTVILGSGAFQCFPLGGGFWAVGLCVEILLIGAVWSLFGSLLFQPVARTIVGSFRVRE